MRADLPDYSTLILQQGGSRTILSRRLRRARGWLEGGLGLLVRGTPGVGEGLWIRTRLGVHTVGLTAPVDLLFLDPRGGVLRVLPGFPPGRWALAPRGTESVVELAAGTAGTVAVGDRVYVEAGPLVFRDPPPEIS